MPTQNAGHMADYFNFSSSMGQFLQNSPTMPSQQELGLPFVTVCHGIILS
jgi:hypothetical protein